MTDDSLDRPALTKMDKSVPIYAMCREHRDPRVTNAQIAAVLETLAGSNRLEGCSELDWLLAQDVCIAVLDGRPIVRDI